MAPTETASIEALRKSVAEDSLYQFVKQAWHIIEPGKPFVDNWHLRLLCAKLEAVSRREIKRLIINVPPRSGKSSIACALWPVWTWLRDPSHQWLTISHSSTFATRDALKSRRVIESPWFQSRWGHKFELTGDQNQKTRYENDKRGYRIALGITAGITGEGGDCVAGDSLVATEWGDIPIADLHAMVSRPRVWSVSAAGVLELRRVVASRRIAQRQTITLSTIAGDVLECTPDHRIRSGIGYKQAKDFLGSALPVVRIADIEAQRASDPVYGVQHGHSQVRGMQEDVHSNGRGARQVAAAQPRQRTDVFTGVQRLEIAFDGETPQVRELRDDVPCEGRAQEVLLEGVRYRTQGVLGAGQEAARQTLRELRDRNARLECSAQVLLNGMQERSALTANDRNIELTVHGQHEPRRVVPPDAPAHPRAGRPSLCSVQRPDVADARPERPPHRLRPGEQRTGEPDHSLRPVPYAAPQIQATTATLDPRGAREAGSRLVDVYDIQVEGNHNFFAGGILVHNCILLDDPHDRDSAHSDIERASALTTYDEAISTRLNEPAKGAIVVIMQRLHVNDLTGHLLAGDEHWDHLCLPMEFEAAHPYRCTEDERKSDGEPLWPARFTPEVVKTLTVRLGSYGAAGQLQQRPNPKGGGIWKTAMLRFYTERPTQWDSLVQSWDMSFKKTTDGSFVVGQVWGKRSANMYLLDEVRERMGYAATRNAMRALKSKWPNALAILVEDKANGPAIMDDLRNEIPGLIAVDTGSDSKMARAESVAPLIESGNVYLPHPSIAPWVNDWLGEVERFPQEPNDRVDAATHALKHMAGDAWADLRANLAALDW